MGSATPRQTKRRRRPRPRSNGTETPWGPLPVSDPTRVYRLRDGARAAELLAAAVVHLDIVSVLGRSRWTMADLCARLGIAPRPAHVLVTLLVALGLLRRQGDSIRATRRAREFLDAHSPFSLLPYYDRLARSDGALDLLDVLRTDRPAGYGAGGDAWAQAMDDAAFAEPFTAEMDCRGAYLGPILARRVDLRGCRRLLDVGGGSGVYACAIAARWPGLEATVFEKPPVDAVARRWLAKRGFESRVGVIAGDMLREPLPRGYDVHLFSNVLHDWAEKQVLELLAKSFAALEPGGVVVVHDALLDRDERGPLHVAEYSVLLLAVTEGRCYSLRELDAMLRQVGFQELRSRPLAAHRTVVSGRKPAGDAVFPRVGSET